MRHRRLVVLGLVDALSWRETFAKCGRKCKVRKRVESCFKHPDQVARRDKLPAETCARPSTNSPFAARRQRRAGTLSLRLIIAAKGWLEWFTGGVPYAKSSHNSNVMFGWLERWPGALASSRASRFC